jgi:hypothetical protein
MHRLSQDEIAALLLEPPQITGRGLDILQQNNFAWGLMLDPGKFGHLLANFFQSTTGHVDDNKDTQCTPLKMLAS